MGDFLSDTADISTANMHLILDAHASINDCIYYLILVQRALFDGGFKPDAWPECGKIFSKAIASVDMSLALINTVREPLAQLPLRTSMQVFDQWLISVKAFARVAIEHALGVARDAMAESTKCVDSLCPRWASCIADGNINLEMAAVMLVSNPNIMKLRASLNDLWTHIMMISQFCGQAGILSAEEHPLTREFLTLAHHSLQFGKDTIKMAAATKVLVERRASEVPFILKHKDVLPAIMLVKLEALMGEPADDDPEPAASRDRKQRKTDANEGASASAASPQAAASGVKLEPRRR